MNKHNISKLLLLVCCTPLLLFGIYCGINIHHLADERETIKKDFCDVNSIEYGLLSVNAWKENIEGIITNRIRDFELTPAQRQDLEQEITAVFKSIISQSDSLIQSNHSLKGKLTTMAYKTFVNKDNLMQKAPAFSHSVVDQILKTKNKEKIKNLAVEKFNEYASQTYSDSAGIVTDSVLAKYHVANKDDFTKLADERIESLQKHIYRLTFMILGIIALFLLAWIVIAKHKVLQKLFFGLSVAVALSVLLVGLTSPMIDIDARIKKIDFMMIGEHIQFHDQVLFYQSKSILEVVRILIATKAIDSMTVGILILMFSVIFPITKLICTQLYLLGKDKIQKNKLVYFFAIKSGKWSMADVMVVAIFMAYVGFRGILNNQLENLNYNTPSLTSISTNLTSLQPAFILFLAFVIYGLILSEILNRIHRVKKNDSH